MAKFWRKCAPTSALRVRRTVGRTVLHNCPELSGFSPLGGQLDSCRAKSRAADRSAVPARTVQPSEIAPKSGQFRTVADSCSRELSARRQRAGTLQAPGCRDVAGVSLPPLPGALQAPRCATLCALVRAANVGTAADLNIPHRTIYDTVSGSGDLVGITKGRSIAQKVRIKGARLVGVKSKAHKQLVFFLPESTLPYYDC